ncbi:MAG: hypothetical protein QM783_16680 [Phycisphaerales bacterium]
MDVFAHSPHIGNYSLRPTVTPSGETVFRESCAGPAIVVGVLGMIFALAAVASWPPQPILHGISTWTFAVVGGLLLLYAAYLAGQKRRLVLAPSEIAFERWWYGSMTGREVFARREARLTRQIVCRRGERAGPAWRVFVVVSVVCGSQKFVVARTQREEDANACVHVMVKDLGFPVPENLEPIGPYHR